MGLAQVLAVAAALAMATPSAAGPLAGQELRRVPAPEAGQGVAVDAQHLYAVGNSIIAKYDKASGARGAAWSGDPEVFPHLNACAVIGAELVCASSNYPRTPMASTVEVFDPASMTHLRSVSLGHGHGSLTWVDRHDGAWWACFANYDGRGGEPGRGHRFTTLVKYDDAWREVRAWTFPASVLERFAPRSSSGGGFGPEGRLYVTGHDRPELYVLSIPATGDVLLHEATVAVPMEGQAIAWDSAQPGVLWGISRAGRQMIAVRVPAIPQGRDKP